VRLFSFISLVGIIGCTSVVSNTSNNPEKELFVGIRDGRLIYKGSITETANRDIFEAFRTAENKPERLLISSVGGDIKLGMELATWVRQHNLDVEVMGICASSCANYVFPSGRKKYLRKDSVLLWHGSAWQSDWDIEDEAKNAIIHYLDEMRVLETNFFAGINVDNLLCVYGQNKFNGWDHFLSLFGKGYKGYDYSLADMERFGLSNIILIDSEWDWRKYRPDKSSLVKRIEVSSDYAFKLRRF
jgi:hypothetical protein